MQTNPGGRLHDLDAAVARPDAPRRGRRRHRCVRGARLLLAGAVDRPRVRACRGRAHRAAVRGGDHRSSRTGATVRTSRRREYPPKNGKARTVPLPAAACDELRVWLAAQKEYRLAQGPAWNEAVRVVPKKDGTQMAPSTLKSQWWNWVARQKIDPHLPIHGLQGLVRHLGLRDLRGQAGAGVARALRPGDHAAALLEPHDRRAIARKAPVYGVNRALSSPISSSISALSFWFMADRSSSLYLGLAGSARLSISSGSRSRS